jgi:hypothetical protein
MQEPIDNLPTGSQCMLVYVLDGIAVFWTAVLVLVLVL